METKPRNLSVRARPWHIATMVAFIMIAAVAAAFVAGNNTATAASTVSFSMDIVPMFTESCTVCHGGEEPSRGLSLEADVAYDNLVNVPAGPWANEEFDFDFMRIQPGVPEVSYLLHKLLGTQSMVGGSGAQMPRGLDPWTEEQVDLVRQWILAGAPNN